MNFRWNATNAFRIPSTSYIDSSANDDKYLMKEKLVDVVHYYESIKMHS